MTLLHKLFLALMIIMVTSGVSACSSSSAKGSELLSFTAEVQRSSTEKSLILVSREGKHYEPVNLPNSFRTIGTVLKVEASRVLEMATTEQAGILIRIEKAELVSEGDGLSENTY